MIVWVTLSIVRDDLRVGLEQALARDHPHQLLGQVHVGRLERAGLDDAEVRLGRLAALGARPELKVSWKEVSLTFSRPFRVGEVGERDLAEGVGLAVGEAGEDDAGRVDLDAAQAAGRLAVRVDAC